MINTDRLNRFIRADEEKMTITVEAGMKLHQLHEYLEFHEMAMSNLGSISDQSVAGLMSTATHGTGAEYPSCCAAVRIARIFFSICAPQNYTKYRGREVY